MPMIFSALILGIVNAQLQGAAFQAMKVYPAPIATAYVQGDYQGQESTTSLYNMIPNNVPVERDSQEQHTGIAPGEQQEQGDDLESQLMQNPQFESLVAIYETATDTAALPSLLSQIFQVASSINPTAAVYLTQNGIPAASSEIAGDVQSTSLADPVATQAELSLAQSDGGQPLTVPTAEIDSGAAASEVVGGTVPTGIPYGQASRLPATGLGIAPYVYGTPGAGSGAINSLVGLEPTSLVATTAASRQGRFGSSAFSPPQPLVATQSALLSGVQPSQQIPTQVQPQLLPSTQLITISTVSVTTTLNGDGSNSSPSALLPVRASAGVVTNAAAPAVNTSVALGSPVLPIGNVTASTSAPGAVNSIPDSYPGYGPANSSEFTLPALANSGSQACGELGALLCAMPIVVAAAVLF